MAYNAPPTQSTGNVIGATAWNRLGDNDKWFADEHATCIVYRSAVQSVPNATDTTVLWTVNLFDNSAIHSTSVNTGRFTAPVGGLFVAMASIGWAADVDGMRHIRWTTNSGGSGGALGIDSRMAVTGGHLTYQQATARLFLSAGDYVELVSYQSAGNALDIATSSTVTFQWARTL